MIKALLHRTIKTFERGWNYDAAYLHDMIDACPRAAWIFSRATAMGQFRRDVPLEAWCTAGITATGSIARDGSEARGVDRRVRERDPIG